VFRPDPWACRDTWREVGRELARLHHRVRSCPDPKGWLDRPLRRFDLAERVEAQAAAGRLDHLVATRLHREIERLQPVLDEPPPVCFCHWDVHAMNVMCARSGSLVALIDWGDAGWADPALDLATVPVVARPFVLSGHRDEAPGLLGEETLEARLAWDRIDSYLWDLEDLDTFVSPPDPPRWTPL
jgi:Ser/Thr protein kinase RdoA (MazF antagonist)